MRALERRLVRLGPALARQRPSFRPPIDEARLTSDEWTEATRIAEVAHPGGWGALSAADLDRVECLAQKLAGEGIDACLA